MKLPAVIILASLLAPATVASPQSALSSHEEAVVALLQLTGLEQTMVGGATAMIDAQIQVNPAIGPYREVMLEWAGKYMTWEYVGPQMIEIYMEAFSEEEVHEIIAFYRTPTGQKALTKMPELMQKGAAIGAEIAEAHKAELEKMILERQEELDSENKLDVD